MLKNVLSALVSILIIAALLAGCFSGCADSSGESESNSSSNSTQESQNSETSQITETAPPIETTPEVDTEQTSQLEETSSYDPEALFDEIDDYLYAITAMEYAQYTVDGIAPSDTLCLTFVPEDKLGSLDDVYQVVSDRIRNYLREISSIDEIFDTSNEDAEATILFMSLLNSNDSHIKDIFASADNEDMVLYVTMVKETLEAMVKAGGYVICTTDEMINDLNDNALRANNKYSEKCVLFEGTVDNIDASGDYISVTSQEDMSLTNIQCFIKSDAVLDSVMDISNGDEVFIIGIVTDVGEVLGYSIDMYMIS